MTEVGLREMRQNASDLVPRVQTGEHVTITVAGRPAGPGHGTHLAAWDPGNTIVGGRHRGTRTG